MATYTKFDVVGYPELDLFNISVAGFEIKTLTPTRAVITTPNGFDIVLTGNNLDVVVTPRPDGKFDFAGKGTVETIARTSVGGSVTYDLITNFGALPFEKATTGDVASLKAIVFGSDDTFVGDAKNNNFDGGPGVDTFFIATTQAEASIKTIGALTTVTSPQGTDNLLNIEKIRFSDGSILDIVQPAQPLEGMDTGFLPAVALSQVVAGVNPTAVQLDVRAKAAQAAHDYYANVLKVLEPALGPYESLGVSFSATDDFRKKYGAAAGDNDDFIAKAYSDIFLREASVAQKAHFAAQISYFVGIYTSVNIDAETAGFQARGAVLGQMVGHVMTSAAERSAAGQLIDDHANAFLASVGLTGMSSSPFSSLDTLA